LKKVTKPEITQERLYFNLRPTSLCKVNSHTHIKSLLEANSESIMDRSHPYQGKTSSKGMDNPCIFIFKIEGYWRWREQLFQASLSLV